MDNAEIMRGLECLRGLQKNRGCAGQGQRTVALEHVGQRLTLDELHGEVDQPVGRFAEVVDRADVGMVDAAGVRCLPVETRDGIGIVYQDRKSTRLNSSHVAISYAVFCLKKKKYKQKK